MRNHGGFEHNLQSLRTSTCSRSATRPLRVSISVSRRAKVSSSTVRWKTLASLANSASAFSSRTQPSLEAQICNLADEIAYNNHDLDDGLRAGLITLDQLEELSLFASHVADVRRLYPGLVGVA
jgi:dGTPase